MGIGIGVLSIVLSIMYPNDDLFPKDAGTSKKQKMKDKDKADDEKYKKYTDLMGSSSRAELNAALSKIEDAEYKKGLLSYLQARYKLDLSAAQMKLHKVS